MATAGATTGSSGALVWSPFPDEETALAAARILVEEKLARCGNVLPGVTSVFEWQGAIDTAREVGLLLKTREDLLETAVSRLGEVHPYETPAVLGWICESGAPATLAWLGELPRKS